jgi:hypothetical protein
MHAMPGEYSPSVARPGAVSSLRSWCRAAFMRTSSSCQTVDSQFVEGTPFDWLGPMPPSSPYGNHEGCRAAV